MQIAKDGRALWFSAVHTVLQEHLYALQCINVLLRSTIKNGICSLILAEPWQWRLWYNIIRERGTYVLKSSELIVRGLTGRWSTYWSLGKCLSRMTHRAVSILESVKLCESAFIADTDVKFRNRSAVPKWQPLTWPGLVQDHLRKTSIVNRQRQFPPVSSRVRANCLMENTTTSSSIRRELQWRKVDLDKKLYGYVFCV